MFQYSVYSYTGREIGIMGDMIVAVLISLIINIHIPKKGVEDINIRVGGMFIGWSWLIAVILRVFFSCQAPFFHL